MTEALRLGTHLKVERTGYTHHGIYVGNGNVVHYSGFAEAFKKGKIELTSIDDFMGDEKDLYRVKYSTQCKPTQMMKSVNVHSVASMRTTTT